MTAAPIPTSDEPVDWAHRYATLGLRVVPIAPGQKRPTLAAWQDAATSDHATIDAWWSGLYRGHGVGIALGQGGPLADAWVFAIDIDQHGTDGEATLADLEAEHGPLPDTWEAITGGGGRHLLFWAEHEIRNGQLGAGIDIRGAGGQIVAEPTVHPSGQRYAWVDGAAPWERRLAEAPRWVLDMLRADERPAERPTASQEAGTRPGDLWGAQTSWAQILEPDGWTYAGRGHEGEDRWVRPGKVARDGISATVGYKGSDVLKVFTSSVPELRADETYTKLGYLAATRHGGDHQAAARALAADGYTTNPPGGEGVDLADLIGEGATVVGRAEAYAADGWPIATSTDITAVLDGSWTPPTPTLLARTDGACLLYPGKIHSLAGEPSSGKTWLALEAVAQTIRSGQIAMLIDHEDRLDTAVRRLASLGATRAEILDGFRYVTPTVRVKGGGLPTNVTAEAAHAALVVIDSMGEALAHDQASQDDDGDVVRWMANTARRLADEGAAVLLLDHVTKDSEHRGRWAIGSQRKLAAIDGASYIVQVVQSFSREKAGRIIVKCSKDRGGNYPTMSTVTEVTINPNGEGVQIVVAPPSDGTEGGSDGFMPTHLMERVSRFLEEHGEATRNAIVDGVHGKRPALRTAVEKLVELGHVATENGPRGALFHRIVEPYREPSNDLDDLVEATGSHWVPTGSQEGGTQSLTGSPPLRGTRSEPSVENDPLGPAETGPSHPVHPPLY